MPPGPTATAEGGAPLRGLEGRVPPRAVTPVSFWANGKVVKVKAFTKNRRSIAALHGVRGFSPAFGAGLQSPVKGH
ncbi:hypothetical protein THTE_0175 [Thermogutta terrifontis]|uniref:Uncharacterized protein n=1 Tax=Thermogutta terrifontis TaxID=1331910 RepID=A0A286RA21_9BACT|nr:hypothetical protein THTE_0175 [Thermogutta terrifontis]